MNIEIERKFLVKNTEYRSLATRSYSIIQGFLNRDPERTVRVRLLDDGGVLTIKGLSSKDGLSRLEWETELTLQEAQDLLALCEEGVIDKRRYEIPSGPYVFEVDEFLGANQGLIIAEIELPETGTAFEVPSWLGEEVTGDERYYNSYLSKRPFNTWS